MARGFVWLTEAGISMAKLYWSTMVDSMIRAINRCVSGQWCQPASAVCVCVSVLNKTELQLNRHSHFM